MLYHYNSPGKLRVLSLGATWIWSLSIGKTTIHSGFGNNPGIKLLGLKDKSKATLKIGYQRRNLRL